MTKMKFPGLIAASCLVLSVAACTPTSQPADTASDTALGTPLDPATADILWDEWGIPHIFAGSDEAMFYASGWAQARAHGDLLLRLYGTSRGRAAEYWGHEQLDSDRWVHTMGVPARAEAWLAAQSDEAKVMLEAFVAGINAYAAAHPDAIDDEVEVVLPVTALDVLGQVQRSIHFTFMAHPLRAKYVGEQWKASRADRQAQLFSESLEPSEPPDLMAGSNAWALSPSRSESGKALLLGNPHLPWSDLFTWFEAQWTSPDFDSYGATLVGFPTPSIAFNDFLGWTHTVNTLDATDVYELKLSDDGTGYVFDGEVKLFETSTVAIRVQNDDGSFSEEELTIRSSVHGPVIARDATGALALRVAGLDQPGLLDQYLAMNRATNLEEFEAASSRLQMPMFTTMYADRDGRVMHLFGGRIPVRPQDQDYEWDAIVPGHTSDTLWTETYAYEQLPKVVDPESGWLQNANDPPWTTTFPRALDPDAFPKYMAPRFMHFRAQQSAQLLESDASMTFEEFEAAKHSTEMEWAVRIVDDLESAVADHGDEQARKAMAVLSSWDRRADADSRGAVLFAALADRVRGAGDGWAATPWRADQPTTTPDGLADPAAAAKLLSQVAGEIELAYGSLDVAWGDVYRLQLDEHDHPASGAPGSLGVFRVLGFAPADDETNRQRAVSGDTYVAVVEFSDPPRARALLSYGNSSQPGSPHRGDQLELLARQELRPVVRERSHLEAGAVEVESLTLPN